MRDDSNRQAGVTNASEVRLSADASEAFRLMFQDWREAGWNQEALEAGGTGDLQDLAARVIAWGRGFELLPEP